MLNMTAKRITFFVHLRTEEDLQKWNELVKEHLGWREQNMDIADPKTIIIPNMTFNCADQIDRWLKDKGLERTWLKDNEPKYYEVLEKIGWL